MKKIAFIDTEVGIADQKIHDIGGVKGDNTIFHAADIHALKDFLADVDYVCGHNLIHHDLVYLEKAWNSRLSLQVIDTLYLSPLLFPKRPYHHLLKDDKLQVEELNNPVNDSVKAKALFADEVTAFNELSDQIQEIFYRLLHDQEEFAGFFQYLDYKPVHKSFFSLLHRETPKDSLHQLIVLIRAAFQEFICHNADIVAFIEHKPVELAYALSLLQTGASYSTTPPWLLHKYPDIENIIQLLCNHPCTQGCPYCQEKLNIHKALQNYFGYDQFRTYNGEPLQERAAQASVNGESLLAVFPTGGGKSLTFQLPALMAGDNAHGLTIVISPLQSLMKDQVDNLTEQGITSAVTINGLLSPVERADSIRMVQDGSASLLYISPEMLRSKTIERLLFSRNIIRLVVDEAHCFSAWGQDFRVDYIYIGDFIREFQEKKHCSPIPISCFTATAKPKVIADICDYFKAKLNLDLKIFAAKTTRENLTYKVIFQENDKEKYITLRSLIEQYNCPTIVYVSRTKKTWALAEQLTSDGFPALPFNGQMESADKITNQETFMEGRVKVIVATSAFGMGVDKKDIRLIVHYDISDSLENYMQESGRAGRDPSLEANCFVLFNDQDLDKHFLLQNQTKLTMSEIQQIWRGIKQLTKERAQICCSSLELARAAGWDDSIRDIETRVKTAVAALEQAGYVKRGQNVPRIYATSICVENMIQASELIDKSNKFDASQKLTAKRIIKSLISSRSTTKGPREDAESRVDYLGDILGIPKPEVIDSINTMREINLLEDSQDMCAYLTQSDKEKRTDIILNQFAKLENFLLQNFQEQEFSWTLKVVNESASAADIPRTSVKNISTLLYFLTIKNYIRKQDNKASTSVLIQPLLTKDAMLAKHYKRISICRFIIKELYQRAAQQGIQQNDHQAVTFSLVGLCRDYRKAFPQEDVYLQDVKDALLYLNKINAMKLEGGFLVVYNGMEIHRLILDNRILYKKEDYATLNQFYQQKIQQIHIVGEFANMMVRNYGEALQFVSDYFRMNYKKFIKKYFKNGRQQEINRNITKKKYQELFGTLSPTQAAIINDHSSQYIPVVAGPGSGKTRVLVHKLAALLLLEDVKHEQLLMLTFSRAAATEFKMRLLELVGNAVNFVEIKTFHSYCFDLLGKVGDLDKVQNVVHDATEMINNGEVEPSKIAKSVLVIDEAQDMDENEYNLIKALINANDEMRIIAVGDDDQNIYEFRGSDSKYLSSFAKDFGGKLYQLNDNYRSKENIVQLSNAFIKPLPNRLKTEPIVAVQKEPGKVQLIKHQGKNFEEAILKQLQEQPFHGSTCILTNTNQEALRIMSLLLKHQIAAKLIQSLKTLKLYNLVEIRLLLGYLKQSSNGPVITDQQLDEAVQKLTVKYKGSECLENCLNLVHEYRTVNNQKFLTDLEQFIHESNYEDFYTHEQNTIYVSTIHKSKGREFDRVFIFLNNESLSDPKNRRKLYVGITRAKSELYIHYNNTLFDDVQLPNVENIVDNKQYPEPKELFLQLSHKQVNLGSFLAHKMDIFKLRSGNPLTIIDSKIMANIEGRSSCVGLLSKEFMQELAKYQQYGYRINRASINFILAWMDKKKEQEAAIILPNIYLIKQ